VRYATPAATLLWPLRVRTPPLRRPFPASARGRPKPPPGTCPQLRLVVLFSGVPSSGDPADLPDRAGLGNLNERTVSGAHELGVRIGLAEVTHRPVVDEVRAVIRTELEVHRTVDAAQH